MPIYDRDDRFLARWLNGELTEAERTAFEQSPEYADFKAIADRAGELKPPAYDQDAAWAELKHTVRGAARSAGRVRRLRRWRAVAAAVGLLVVAGAAWFWMGQTEVQTLAQEQQEILLPDGSTVVLNSQSSVAYNRHTWRWRRQIALRGEGFFDVQEGKRFLVQADNGQVEVLGTSFNVYDRRDALEVHCLSGQVAVTAGSTAASVVLEVAETVRFQGGQGAKARFEQENAPAWQRGQSNYQEASLGRVLDDLEYQFGVQILRAGIDENRRFTGTFLHDELEVALDMVLAPMGIRYERDGQQLRLRQ
jgi:transmembrane sensor